jgi:hypothetical protein
MTDNNVKNVKIEDILDEALELQRNGVATEEICNQFPEHKSELQELLGVTSTLKQATLLTPSYNLAENIIRRYSNNLQAGKSGKAQKQYIWNILAKSALAVGVVAVVFTIVGAKFLSSDNPSETLTLKINSPGAEISDLPSFNISVENEAEFEEALADLKSLALVTNKAGAPAVTALSKAENDSSQSLEVEEEKFDLDEFNYDDEEINQALYNF